MKFGKRLQVEAARRWVPFYIDYKVLKRAIQDDKKAADRSGTAFESALCIELGKVAAFYQSRESELSAALDAAGTDKLAIAAFLPDLQDLRKFVVLNYIAVVKAVKKRNRHLREVCGEAATTLRAVNILTGQPWFTSLRLAGMTTRADIAAREAASAGISTAAQTAGVAEDFQCPICLSILRSPVILTCAHRFCWGCLVAHCSAVSTRSFQRHPQPRDAKEEQVDDLDKIDAAFDRYSSPSLSISDDNENISASPRSPSTVVRPAVWEGEASDDDTATVATFQCPCCRKDELLDLDRLQVDPHLEAFLQRLEGQQSETSSAISREQSTGVQRDICMAHCPENGAASASAPHETHKEKQQQSSSAPIPIHASVHCTAGIRSARHDSMQTSSASLAIAAAEKPSPTIPRPFVASSTIPKQVTASNAHLGKHSFPQTLLPPQRREHQGRITVCLDLDGTLVTTFTPKRAPSLPSSMATYVVGKGGKLNPGGVFVVERPGLGHFLRRLSTFSEVVVFTAGLEDYAAPILAEIERRYGSFAHRLYRPATMHTDAYPCVKDMARERLGREEERVVLVDDTPLAFFHQPDNGIPVLQFRGDVDDRILTEAVGPLLEALAGEADVRKPLARRFNMRRWFAAQGLRAGPPAPQQLLSRAPSAPAVQVGAAKAQQRRQASPSSTRISSAAKVLLVCDFDKTLTDWDAGERLCDELAPELTSLLSQMESPANFVPATNAVLAEMHRRGVTREVIVAALQRMGDEMPQASREMLRWSQKKGIDICVLSDCNSFFISNVIVGAKMQAHVREVITNSARFEHVQTSLSGSSPAHAAQHGRAAAIDDVSPAQMDASAGASSSAPQWNATNWLPFRRGGAHRPPTPSSSASVAALENGLLQHHQQQQQHRLVVSPRHDAARHGPHGCMLCPSNLCKGQELDVLRDKVRARVIYAGDGANDLCPALTLGADDVVLARAGHSLEKLLNERRDQVVAQILLWRTHSELFELVKRVADE